MSRSPVLRLLPILLILGLAACGTETSPASDGGAAAPADAASGLDAEPDAGETPDTGAPDTGALDAGATPDAGTVDSGVPADTWESFARDFTDTYCVACHGAGNQMRDYTGYADLFRDRDRVRCGVSPTRAAGCGRSPAPRQFPVGNGPKPSDPERSRLVEWIEAGAPER